MSPGKVVLSLEELEITRFKKDKDFWNTYCLFVYLVQTISSPQIISWSPCDFQAFTRAVLPHNLPGEKLSKFSQSLGKQDSGMTMTTRYL